MSVFEANLAKANSYLARFRDGCVLHQIDGEAVPASDGATFDTISPVDLKPLAKVAHGKAADVDRAAKAAKRAFAGWAALSGEKRKQVLHEVADAIVARAEEIAFIECMDTGQALKFMAKAALRGERNRPSRVRSRRLSFYSARSSEADPVSPRRQLRLSSAWPVAAAGHSRVPTR
jgi:5-carboxymethyl-2-hydroxymuconic-semialdehyde dehydrogenase